MNIKIPNASDNGDIWICGPDRDGEYLVKVVQPLARQPWQEASEDDATHKDAVIWLTSDQLKELGQEIFDFFNSVYGAGTIK